MVAEITIIIFFNFEAELRMSVTVFRKKIVLTLIPYTISTSSLLKLKVSHGNRKYSAGNQVEIKMIRKLNISRKDRECWHRFRLNDRCTRQIKMIQTIRLGKMSNNEVLNVKVIVLLVLLISGVAPQSIKMTQTSHYDLSGAIPPFEPPIIIIITAWWSKIKLQILQLQYTSFYSAF